MPLVENMGRLLRFFCRARKGPLPKGMLLHISDTPSTMYSHLRRLLDKLSPSWIVHTGDLADDVKLERSPRCLDLYEKRVRTLLKLLEESTAKEVYLVLGNHDDERTLQKFASRSIIVRGCTDIFPEGRQIRIAHRSEELLHNPAPINLFGHDVSLEGGFREDKLFLNGIEFIHLLDLHKKEIYYLDYPFGTNDARLLRRRFRG